MVLSVLRAVRYESHTRRSAHVTYTLGRFDTHLVGGFRRVLSLTTTR